jgi:hypothetical protein
MRSLKSGNLRKVYDEQVAQSDSYVEEEEEGLFGDFLTTNQY